jgi:hypothetical protein
VLPVEVVEVTDRRPLEQLVPALVAAAVRGGYREVLAPWSPDPDAEPVLVHRVYRRAL